MTPRKLIGAQLVSDGLITARQLETVLGTQLQFQGRLGTNLVELGFLKEDVLATALGRQHGVPAVRLSDFERVDRALLRRLPARAAAMYRAVPLWVVPGKGNQVCVAMMDPHNLSYLDELATILNHRIVPAVAPEITMVHMLHRLYGVDPPARDFVRVIMDQADLDLPGQFQTRAERPVPAPPPPAQLQPPPLLDLGRTPAALPAWSESCLAALPGDIIPEIATHFADSDPRRPQPMDWPAPVPRAAVRPVGDTEATIPRSPSIKAQPVRAVGHPNTRAAHGATPSLQPTLRNQPPPPSSPSAAAPRPALAGAVIEELSITDTSSRSRDPRREHSSPPAPAAAAPQPAPAPAAVINRLSIADTSSRSPDPRQEPPAPPAPAAAAPQPALGLDAAIEQLSTAAVRDDVGALVVSYLASRYECGLLLLVKDGLALGWMGFIAHGDRDLVESVVIPLTVPSIFQVAFEENRVLRGPPVGEGEALYRRLWKLLRCAPPREVLVAPVAIGERVVNLAYAHPAASYVLPFTAEAELEGLVRR